MIGNDIPWEAPAGPPVGPAAVLQAGSQVLEQPLFTSCFYTQPGQSSEVTRLLGSPAALCTRGVRAARLRPVIGSTRAGVRRSQRIKTEVFSDT